MAYFPTASSGAFQRGRSSTRTPGAYTEQMKVQGAKEGSYYADLAGHMAKIASAEEMEANRLDEMSRQFDEKLEEQMREFDITSEFKRDQLGAQTSLGYAGLRSNERVAELGAESRREIAQMGIDFESEKLDRAEDLALKEFDYRYGDTRDDDFLRATLGQQETFLEDVASRTETNPLLQASSESSGPVVNEKSSPSYYTMTPVGSTDRVDSSGRIDWGDIMSDELSNF